MSAAARGHVDNRLTKEQVLGTEKRWRRFGEPTPAGGSLKADGSPDYGLFGPGSVVWEVLLHPATLVFLNAAQGQMQGKGYKPIVAGLRDRDPISRKAQQGTLTIFDVFERGSRNAGMHAPMWLGDTDTARRMAKHLHNIHQRVAGDIIDVGRPELGGYAASEPREAMWAALTEMHPMLWAFEAFAFRNGKLPHRLSPQQRDQYVAEVAEYCRLHNAPEEDVPTTMAELAALYAKYDELFRYSETINILPETGQDYAELVQKAMGKNFHISHLRAALPVALQFVLMTLPVTGAMSGKARRSIGLGPVKDKLAQVSTKLALPVAWLMQQPPFERYILRLMWGPDSIMLIESARKLHKQALAERSAGPASR
jgi:uncharacterized protein (DUF2236 family)